MPDRDNYVVPDYPDGELPIFNAAAVGDRVRFREGGLILFRNVHATLSRDVTMRIWSQGGDPVSRTYTVPALGFLLVGMKDTGTVDGQWIPLSYSATADVSFCLIQYVRQ